MVKTISISSSVYKSRRDLKVWLPEDYDAGIDYQAIYVLDADYLFNLTCGIVDFMMKPWIDQMPPSIVIGVSYSRFEDREDVGFSLTDDTINDKGKVFFQFLLREVPAAIKDLYSLAGYQVLIGHSYTAAYLHYLISRSVRTFGGCIAIAPESLSGKPTDKLIQALGKIQKPARLFSGVGSEDIKPRKAYVRYLSKGLAGTNQMISKGKVYAGEDHVSLMPLAIRDGLSFIYKDYYGFRQIAAGKADSMSVRERYREAVRRNRKNYHFKIRATAQVYHALKDWKDDEKGSRWLADEFSGVEDIDLLQHIGVDLLAVESVEGLVFLERAIRLAKTLKRTHQAALAYRKLIRWYESSGGKPAQILDLLAEACMQTSDLLFYYEFANFAFIQGMRLDEALAAINHFDRNFTPEPGYPDRSIIKKLADNLLSA